MPMACSKFYGGQFHDAEIGDEALALEIPSGSYPSAQGFAPLRALIRLSLEFCLAPS